MPPYATAPELRRFDIGSVERGEVLRYLGYRGQVVAPDLDDRVDANIARCLEVCQPAGVVRVFDVKARAGEAPELVDAVVRLEGRSIARHLRGAVAVALMSVTLGLVSERELNRLALTSALDQVIFDAAASALVERAADAAEARIVALAAERRLCANDRFAPGYGDLGLEVQGPLLDALGARKLLGVSLTPSNMLVPTKSETAVVGLFAEVPPRRQGGLCGECAMREFCEVRKAGRTCRG